MAKYEVLKPLKDKQTQKLLKVGDIIDRTVKEVDAFEKQHGKDYLKRVDDNDQQTKAKTQHKG